MTRVANLELTLPATGARLAGLRSGPGAPTSRTPRVLALHGWLDNSLSWRSVLDGLDGFEVVCIDFPGHGASPPRPAAARYHFDDYVFDVLGALDALGWDDAHLLGHSLGGAVASVTAAACPERVRTLSVVEGLGPLTAPGDRTAENWRKAVRTARERPRRVHRDRASAIDARVRNSDLPRAAAERLAERGLDEVDGGWQWRHDQRLTWPSTQRYTEPQVLDLLAAIDAPTLCVLATPRSRLLPDGLMERRAAAVRTLQLIEIEGGHHVHMQQPDAVSRRIKDHIHAHHADH